MNEKQCGRLPGVSSSLQARIRCGGAEWLRAFEKNSSEDRTRSWNLVGHSEKQRGSLNPRGSTGCPP